LQKDILFCGVVKNFFSGKGELSLAENLPKKDNLCPVHW
jgi:hypothetical protein